MSFEIKVAVRRGIKPLIGFYSESGCGKTLSSLLVARGMAGDGKVVVIDTESGRASVYADVVPGGYQTLELTEPFTPARYIEAIRAVEQSGAAVGIIDSASHEWSGIGGISDMAQAEEDRGMKALGVWKVPKMEHAKFVAKLLQSPIPWIVCLRAKHKSRQVKNEKGRTEIVKDDFCTPTQADDFIYEMTTHGCILPNHHYMLTKPVHPALDSCFPKDGMLTVETGKRIAAWCLGNKPDAPEPKKESKSGEALQKLKVEAWKATMPIHKGDPKIFQQHLWDEAIMSDTEALDSIPEQRMIEVMTKAIAHAKKGTPK